jgi:hypothetical protein
MPLEIKIKVERSILGFRRSFIRRIGWCCLNPCTSANTAQRTTHHLGVGAGGLSNTHLSWPWTMPKATSWIIVVICFRFISMATSMHHCNFWVEESRLQHHCELTLRGMIVGISSRLQGINAQPSLPYVSLSCINFFFFFSLFRFAAGVCCPIRLIGPQPRFYPFLVRDSSSRGLWFLKSQYCGSSKWCQLVKFWGPLN